MVHVAKLETTEAQHDEMVATMMAGQDCDQELVRVTHTVTLKSLSKSLLLGAKNTKSIVRVDNITHFERDFCAKLRML